MSGPGGAARSVLLAPAVALVVALAAGCTTSTGPAPVPAAPRGPAVADPPPVRAGHDTKWVCAFLQENTIEAVTAFETAVGRPLDCVATYVERRTWADVTGVSPLSVPGDQLVPWVAADPAHRRLVLSVPMVPQSETTDPDWRRNGADGAYDEQWRAFGARAVSLGLGRSVLRLGWEMNGSWFPENYVGTTDAQVRDWRAYFQRVVTILRSVQGAEFLVDFNVNMGGSDASDEDGDPRPLTDWFPGRGYVDAVGVDLYDRWIPGVRRSTPPRDWSAQEKADWYEERWRALTTLQNSLQDCLDLAREQGLPVSVGEWAMTADVGGSAGGGDDPHFVTRLLETVQDNPTLYTAYADYPGGGIGMVLTDAPQGLQAFREGVGPAGAVRPSPAGDG